MRGYRSMGSECSEKMPSRTIAMEMTAAKIGRRTKKYLISGSLVMCADPKRRARRRGQHGIAASRASGVGRRHVCHRTHGGARHDLLNPVHHHAIAGAQPAADEPLAADERVTLHIAAAHFVRGIDDEHVRPSDALLHGALRDEDRADPPHAEQRYTDELPRQQRVLRIAE